MIQKTLFRLKGLDIGTPIVSCGESHRFMVAQQVGEVSDTKPTILLEPIVKNTAPAIAAACCAAMKQDEDAVVIVLPSDHAIKNGDTYREAVMNAAKQAEKGFMVTFGIIPTFPATGYGYIKGGPSKGSETTEKRCYAS